MTAQPPNYSIYCDYRKKHLKTPVIEAAPSESVIEPIDNPTDTDPTSRELSDSEDEEPAEPSTPRTKVYTLIMLLYIHDIIISC